MSAEYQRRRRRLIEMRVILVAIAVAGCGAPARMVASSGDLDPHSSRDALVRAMFVRVSAGDLDGLIELATKRPAYDRVLVCSGARPDDETEGLREALSPPVRSGKGLAIDVVAIELSTEEQVSTISAGEHYEATCKTSAPIVWYPLTAKLRIRKAGGAPREASAWVNVFDIGGRWYLAALQPQLD
jgi:hypothetical protein